MLEHWSSGEIAIFKLLLDGSTPAGSISILKFRITYQNQDELARLARPQVYMLDIHL